MHSTVQTVTAEFVLLAHAARVCLISRFGPSFSVGTELSKLPCFTQAHVFAAQTQLIIIVA